MPPPNTDNTQASGNSNAAANPTSNPTSTSPPYEFEHTIIAYFIAQQGEESRLAHKQRMAEEQEEQDKLRAEEAEKQRAEAEWQEDLRFLKIEVAKAEKLAELYAAEEEKRELQRAAELYAEEVEKQRLAEVEQQHVEAERLEELSTGSGAARLDMLYRMKAKQLFELDKQRLARERAELQAAGCS
jgi:hypothetical protein